MPRLPLSALLCLLLPVAALAQEDSPTGLAGTITDSLGLPIDGAVIEVIGARRTAQTTPSGRFRIEDLRPGGYWVLVRMVGYRPYQQSITIQKHQIRYLNISLGLVPIQLDEIVVEERNKVYQSRMRDFIWRSRTAWGGRFMTADDLARRNPHRLGDMVIRYMPGKLFQTMNEPGGFYMQGIDDDRWSIARFSRRYAVRAACPPAVALNGGGILTGLAVNDFNPADVEAVEVYREGVPLPIEYSWAGRATCGLVVVWMKSYARFGLGT